MGWPETIPPSWFYDKPYHDYPESHTYLGLPEGTTDNINDFINQIKQNDAGRKKPMHGTVAHYEPPNYEPWQGIRGITTPYYQPVNQSLFIDDYEFKATNEKENLCSRHLWQ